MKYQADSRCDSVPYAHSMSGETSEQWEMVYKALASPYRRSTLRYLRTNSTPVTFDDVIDHLVDDGHVPSAPAEISRARTKLYHIHIPKLRDADLAEWDGSDYVRPSRLLQRLPSELLSPRLQSHTEPSRGSDD